MINKVKAAKTTSVKKIGSFYKPCPSCSTSNHVARHKCLKCQGVLRTPKINVPTGEARPTVSDLDLLLATIERMGGARKAADALSNLAPLIERMGGVEATTKLLGLLAKD